MKCSPSANRTFVAKGCCIWFQRQILTCSLKCSNFGRNADKSSIITDSEFSEWFLAETKPGPGLDELQVTRNLTRNGATDTLLSAADKGMMMISNNSQLQGPVSLGDQLAGHRHQQIDP